MGRVERIGYMDWMRIVVILMLVPFHSAVTCAVPGDAFIKYNQDVPGLSLFIWFISIWNMPALFVVSGMSSFYALQYRSAGQYMQERLSKLLMPFFIGTITICMIMAYFRALYLGTFQGGFFGFFPHFFTEGPYPKGNFNWGHLWFLIYLFLFTLLLLPVFRYLQKENVREKAVRISFLLERGLWVFILALPIMLTESFLRPKFSGTLNIITDWANFTQYLILTFYGYLLALNPRIVENIERIRVFSLAAGIALFAVAFAAHVAWGDVRGSSAKSFFPAYNALMVFAWVLAVMGYAKKYLNFKSRLHSYLTDASFPFYIFHYLPITVTAFCIAASDIGIWFKFFILVACAYPVTFIIYEAVRRMPYIRFLFGIKERASGFAEVQAEA